jgi:hypothetical protein
MEFQDHCVGLAAADASVLQGTNQLIDALLPPLVSRVIGGPVEAVRLPVEALVTALAVVLQAVLAAPVLAEFREWKAFEALYAALQMFGG